MFDKVKVDNILQYIDFSMFDVDDFSSDWVENEFLGSEEYDYLTEELDFNICYGATKLVFIPPEKYDFVIKIPFKGVYAEYEDEDGDEDWKYHDFTCAVYPLSGECGDDYCLSEAQYYSCAVEVGIEKMFCGTFYYTRIDNIPIYVSEKAHQVGDSFCEVMSCAEIDTTQKLINSTGLHNVFNYRFFNRALKFVGLEYVENFYHFLEDNGLHDFYSANYGILENGCPVIIDYSDYREKD